MDTIRFKSDEICPRKDTWSSFNVLSSDTGDTRDTEQSTSYSLMLLNSAISIFGLSGRILALIIIYEMFGGT